GDGGGGDADGSSGSGSDGSSSTGATIVDEVPAGGIPIGGADPNGPPTIVGGGSNSAPLGAGCGPETAGECHPVGGDCNPGSDTQVIQADSTCFYTPEAEQPSAVAEWVIEVVNGQEYVHLRVTFDPYFVDNVYGECAAQTGWGGDEEATEPEPEPMDPMGGKPKPMDGMKPPKGGKGGHTFNDLVGSDHVELMLSDCDGGLAMHVKLDYISEASSSACGYANGGVTVGEGKVIVGSADHVLASSSSLDRNMNGCGYCELENSPCPGENYATDPNAPQWDFRVVYEMWIDPAAFGDAGFCGVDIDAVHASPSKADDNTVLVEPDDCPPPPCPPSYELYLTSEGEQVCVPSGDCPDGYVIDLTSEGESCVAVK
ncbi:MAG TPA: hypothetical protein VNN80_34670, partial [Polyangiaceae bacterium]|nr:hypothetical protein [Polyangiaceae bacterium]